LQLSFPVPLFRKRERAAHTAFSVDVTADHQIAFAFEIAGEFGSRTDECGTDRNTIGEAAARDIGHENLLGKEGIIHCDEANRK
jgi:hypothetical protein